MKDRALLAIGVLVAMLIGFGWADSRAATSIYATVVCDAEGRCIIIPDNR